MRKGDLTHLATPGSTLSLRVTPKASANRVIEDDGTLRIYVTAVPADGAANDAVQKLLAKALGIAKTRLSLIQGATSRNKVFRID
ncbi:DUF167 domain-containing protein [Puniceibacterium sediminis]|uniref:UPF0235 protein SAMN06265370_12538 n=1 Tax=Puniceibacterium sediminis TaxID=1608407 RepID=A0A238Z7K3_9RHOB|nr:DUF167 domain-containing protein [Puniceibacterium sediminis]SNR79455.1 hypothetical protein SAMN06265370_12538 [Puniceibacterium sediminis]